MDPNLQDAPPPQTSSGRSSPASSSCSCRRASRSSRPGLRRAKNAAHTMAHELHGLPDRHARVLDAAGSPADGRRGRDRHVRRRRDARRASSAINLVRARTSACSARRASSCTATVTTPAVVALFLFQMVFMDTTATIPTGAMAERWKFSAFVLFSFVHRRRSSTRSTELGLGRRLALAARHELRPRPRPRRLRRQLGRAHDRAA